MTSQLASQSDPPIRRSKSLMITTTLYGLLYLVFIVDIFILFLDGSPVSGITSSKPLYLEQIYLVCLFVVFLIGYVALWRNEGVGGAIFIGWWIGMWGFDLFIQPDGDGGIGPGLPLFILGILFLKHWYKGRDAHKATSDEGPTSDGQ